VPQRLGGQLGEAPVSVPFLVGDCCGGGYVVFGFELACGGVQGAERPKGVSFVGASLSEDGDLSGGCGGGCWTSVSRHRARAFAGGASFGFGGSAGVVLSIGGIHPPAGVKNDGRRVDAGCGLEGVGACEAVVFDGPGGGGAGDE